MPMCPGRIHIPIGLTEIAPRVIFQFRSTLLHKSFFLRLFILLVLWPRAVRVRHPQSGTLDYRNPKMRKL